MKRPTRPGPLAAMRIELYAAGAADELFVAIGRTGSPRSRIALELLRLDGYPPACVPAGSSGGPSAGLRRSPSAPPRGPRGFGRPGAVATSVDSWPWSTALPQVSLRHRIKSGGLFLLSAPWLRCASLGCGSGREAGARDYARAVLALTTT